MVLPGCHCLSLDLSAPFKPSCPRLGWFLMAAQAMPRCHCLPTEAIPCGHHQARTEVRVQGSREGGGDQVEGVSALSTEPPPCQAQAVRRDTAVGAAHHPALVGPLRILKPEAFEKS